MINEGVPVVLVLFEDEIVAALFGQVRRIGLMPLEENLQIAHLGTIEVRGDQGQVGGLPVRAVIANRHVEKSPCDIAHGFGWRLKGVSIHGPTGGKALGFGDVEEEGSSVRVHPVVGGKDMVEVGVVGALLVGISARAGPEMFAIPKVHAGLGDGLAGIDLN